MCAESGRVHALMFLSGFRAAEAQYVWRYLCQRRNRADIGCNHTRILQDLSRCALGQRPPVIEHVDAVGQNSATICRSCSIQIMVMPS